MPGGPTREPGAPDSDMRWPARDDIIAAGPKRHICVRPEATWVGINWWLRKSLGAGPSAAARERRPRDLWGGPRVVPRQRCAWNERHGQRLRGSAPSTQRHTSGRTRELGAPGMSACAAANARPFPCVRGPDGRWPG
eukprot:8360596-Alexandrium_andersonii.AAC.1